jgi:hypothetical protein
MTNETDKRPLSERLKDGSYTPPPEAAKLFDRLKEQDERNAAIVRSFTAIPAKEELTLSPEQIEAIAEAVANRVVAKLRAEPK